MLGQYLDKVSDKYEKNQNSESMVENYLENDAVISNEMLEEEIAELIEDISDNVEANVANEVSSAINHHDIDEADPLEVEENSNLEVRDTAVGNIQGSSVMVDNIPTDRHGLIQTDGSEINDAASSTNSASNQSLSSVCLLSCSATWLLANYSSTSAI